MHKIHLSTGLLYFLQKVLTYHALYQTGPGVSINCEQLMTKKHPEDQNLRGARGEKRSFPFGKTANL